VNPDTELNAEEIAKLLNCHRATVYRLWNKGKLAKIPYPFKRSRSRYGDVQALAPSIIKGEQRV
jgi:excisionase family DNA binding protein